MLHDELDEANLRACVRARVRARVRACTRACVRAKIDGEGLRLPWAEEKLSGWQAHGTDGPQGRTGSELMGAALGGA